MIKFFHHIRQSLIAESRFGKYLLYVMGEIILVVIGILIALSINNWNETRKANQFEHEILALIDQNLERDSILISIELSKSNEAIKLTNRLLTEVAQQNYNDSFNRWMGKIISFERFK